MLTLRRDCHERSDRSARRALVSFAGTPGRERARSMELRAEAVAKRTVWQRA